MDCFLPLRSRNRTRLFIRGLIVICSAFCLVILTGCAAVLISGGAALGAGSVIYLRGELRAVENLPLDTVWKAAQTGMKDLELAVVTQEKDALRARLKARGAGDRKVILNLKSKGEHLTELRIRVGFLGDKTLSQAILEAVRKRYAGTSGSKS